MLSLFLGDYFKYLPPRHSPEETQKQLVLLRREHEATLNQPPGTGTS